MTLIAADESAQMLHLIAERQRTQHKDWDVSSCCQTFTALKGGTAASTSYSTPADQLMWLTWLSDSVRRASEAAAGEPEVRAGPLPECAGAKGLLLSRGRSMRSSARLDVPALRAEAGRPSAAVPCPVACAALELSRCWAAASPVPSCTVQFDFLARSDTA